MASTFGRKTGDDGDLAAKRAAFIAAERARAAEQRDAPDEGSRPASRYAGRARVSSAVVAAKAPVYGDEKTLFAAYINWFLFGCLGAHRFYLGYTTSGAVQAMMSVGAALVLFMAASDQSLVQAGLGLFLLGTLSLWLLADLVLIPSMCERANARLRRSETKRSLALD